MFEVSAAVPSALAQSGAVLAAASAVPGAEGPQVQDFSALLAGAALASETPAFGSETSASVPFDPTAASQLAGIAPASPGKSGTPGNAPGKNLPAGKLPAARALVAAEKLLASQTREDETADEEAEPAKASLDLSPPVATPASLPTTDAKPAILLAAAVLQDAPATPASIASHEEVVPAASDSPHATKRSSARDPMQSPLVAARVSSASVAKRAMSQTEGGLPSTPATTPRAARQTPPLMQSAVTGAPSALASAEPITAAPAVTIAASATAPALPLSVSTIAATPPAPTIEIKVAQEPARSDAASVIRAEAPLLPANMPSTVQAILAQQLPSSSQADQASGTLTARTSGQAGQVATAAVIDGPAGSAGKAAILSAASPAILWTAASPMVAEALGVAGNTAQQPVSSPAAPFVQALPDPSLAESAVAARAASPQDVAARVMTHALPVVLVGEQASQPAPIPADTKLAAPAKSIRTVGEFAGADQFLPRTLTATVQPAPALIPAAEHKQAHAIPAAASDVILAVTPADMTPVSPVAGARSAPEITPTPAPAGATTTTQDIAALVDRITEARAAAAPHTVRAALVHEDFGSVSLNFRTDASHIHVTLGSADPGFAPAVQAAAAASLAGNAAGDDASPRRDTPAPQASAQPQGAAARDDASQQQASRDRAPAAERQTSREQGGRQPRHPADTSASAPTPRRRGGLYA